MKYLLDTHILVWWFEANRKLSQDFKVLIEDPKNAKYVSVASFWEIIIKTNTKKLKLDRSIDFLAKNMGFEILDIKLNHILELNKLPNIHRDPFDRIIISQTKVENCILLTADEIVKSYFKD